MKTIIRKEALKTFTIVRNIQPWLSKNRYKLRRFTMVYSKGKFIGTLNKYKGCHMFILALTKEEWDLVDELVRSITGNTTYQKMASLQ